MNDIKKAQIAKLVDRIQCLQDRSGGTFTPPSWMLDKNRHGENTLTLEEQQEWAVCVCNSMRASIAIRYQIECANRWGRRDGEFIFKDKEMVLAITQQLIENILTSYIESVILTENPEDKYLAVFLFYHQKEQDLKCRNYCWFRDFLDTLLIDSANELRAGGVPRNPVIH